MFNLFITRNVNKTAYKKRIIQVENDNTKYKKISYNVEIISADYSPNNKTPGTKRILSKYYSVIVTIILLISVFFFSHKVSLKKNQINVIFYIKTISGYIYIFFFLVIRYSTYNMSVVQRRRRREKPNKKIV